MTIKGPKFVFSHRFYPTFATSDSVTESVETWR